MSIRLLCTAALFACAFAVGCEGCVSSEPGPDAEPAAEPDDGDAGGLDPDVNADGGEPDVGGDGGEPGVGPVDDGGEPDVVVDDGGGFVSGRDAFCAGSGGLIPTNVGGDRVCSGDIAARSFRYALCTCDDLVTSGQVVTAGFDSQTNQSNLAAAVGTNGGLTSSLPLDIGGSLWVAGNNGLVTSADVTVGGALLSGGRVVTGPGDLDVGQFAMVNGDVIAGTTSVGGDFTVPDGALVQTSGMPNVVRADVDVPPPCDCAAEHRVDVAGIVNAQQDFAHNDDVGLVADAFANVNETTSHTFECGRYRLVGIAGSGDLTFTIRGRVALFVDGDITTGGTFTIELDGADAELDLFVNGGWTGGQATTIGDTERPRAVRMYLNGDVNLSGDLAVAANVSSPTGALTLSGDNTLHGSFLVRRVSSSGTLDITYDAAVLALSDDCDEDVVVDDDGGMSVDAGDPPGDTCDSCRDCDNQACTDGTCGACVDNADCCAPLFCLEGTCTYLSL